MVEDASDRESDTAGKNGYARVHDRVGSALQRRVGCHLYEATQAVFFNLLETEGC